MDVNEFEIEETRFGTLVRTAKNVTYKEINVKFPSHRNCNFRLCYCSITVIKGRKITADELAASVMHFISYFLEGKWEVYDVSISGNSGKFWAKYPLT